jgi:hypothetical protein
VIDIKKPQTEVCATNKTLALRFAEW